MNNAEINTQKLARLKLTRIVTIRVNFMERQFPIIRYTSRSDHYNITSQCQQTQEAKETIHTC